MITRRACRTGILFFVYMMFVEKSMTTYGFVSLPACRQYVNTLSLHAKKVKRSSNKRSDSGGGGGFGKPVAAATPSSVINFSGQSGSGTKALRKVANQYDSIRKKHGVEACRDVYVRSPLHSPTTFWFVGKIACVPTNDDDRFIETGLLLKRIIFEYSKDQLRPQNMGGKYASGLELWLAPGDSEMDVATNKVNLEPIKGSLSDTPTKLKADEIGYDPEVYVGDERVKGGLRVERDENGVTTKPPFEVNLSQ